MPSAEMIGRTRELATLERMDASGKAEFLVLYGRRRVGKTFLLKNFIKDRNHIYLLADLQKEERLLESFSGVLSRSAGKPYLELRSWDALFHYIAEQAGKRVILVLDEVGYLNRANPAFYSILQRHWDERLSESKVFLVLCGSSVSMMEKDVLGYGSPLYGRRTGQIELHPFRYREARAFFPRAPEDRRIELYSMLGGIPAYIKSFLGDKDLLWNIENNVLDPNRFLYKEPRFVLVEELREPSTYFSVLTAISQGAAKFNDISGKSYVEPTKLSKYLDVLMDLRLVERVRPVTEKKAMRRNSIYRIRDHFFRFWFRFVAPNASFIEEGRTGPVMDQVRAGLPGHVSGAFEEVCREAVRDGICGGLSFTDAGSWWDNRDEIDIVAFNEKTREILFGECKWTVDKTGPDTLLALADKAKRVQWHPGKRKEYYALFSRAGFTDKCKKIASEAAAFCYDISALEKCFDSGAEKTGS